MTTDIEITVELGITRVVYRGEVQFEVNTEVLRKVARIASESQSRLLLFDVRDADYRHYHASAMSHAEQGPSLGIDGTFRVAFLGSKGDQVLQYVEDVTVNRGFQSKAFTDESEAVAWLRSAL